MKRFLVLLLLVAYTAAGPTKVPVQSSQDLNCLERDDDFFSCMFVKTVTAINRAARSSDIEIVSGITFVRDTPMERSSKSLTINEVEIMNELPRDNSDKITKLSNMLYDSAISFMKSHSLKLSLPEGSVERALSEGRAKIKKMIFPLIAAAGLKIFALVPILLGGLGLLALKAYVLGKIALFAAGVVAFNKLFGGSNVAGGFFNKNPAPVWYDNGAAGNWVAGGSPVLQHQGYRSFEKIDEKVDAHNLAYSAHAPDVSGIN
ncbi:uncharacterized protein LOC105198785 [Solenopsis invicta]|uniref:uncharacterized protein LOC105198785 n=1 Tax=Solenopsis invicta TaxID=13686 RepID=UPI0005960671|nr:uncharacterized protein LOC105198785 [Solenopsis invicta]